MTYSECAWSLSTDLLKDSPKHKYTSDQWFENMIPAYSQTLGRPVSLSYVRYMDRYTISMEDVRAASSERRAHLRRIVRLKRKLKLLVS